MVLKNCKALTDPTGEIYNSPLQCVQRLPESGNVLGPWVAISFMVGGGSGPVITVGNDSSPMGTTKNGAVIKSFSFGHETGVTVRVTIHDQAGGSFQVFMDNLFKDWKCAEESAVNNTMQFQFGWCKSGCPYPYQDACSPCYYAIMDSIETSFMEGKFIAEITGKDICSRTFEGGTEQPQGGDGTNGMCLKTAIKEMLTNSEAPNVGDVQFKTYMGGMIKDIGFEYYDIGCEECTPEKILSKRHRKDKEGICPNKGPKGKWITSGEDKLSVARRWLSGWRTQNKKSWVEVFDPTHPKGRVIYWEDRKPFCEDRGDGYWTPTCIGKYIVNGGKASPVIEFNPKIRWDFSRMQSVGGGTSNESVNALDTEGSKTPGRIDCGSLVRERIPGAGHTMGTVVPEVNKDFSGEDAAKMQQKGNQAFARAQESVLLHNMIEADLVVVGDPLMVEPIFAREQKNVSILFINPYYLVNKGSGACPDWTAIPPTNDTLSNLAWIVSGVTHHIEAGRYTTTLNVKLAAPGIEGDVDAHLGLWKGGWKPKGTC